MLRDAALQLGISFPTMKQRIYKKKIRSNRTREDIIVSRRAMWTDCFSERGKTEQQRKEEIRRVSGRNQLVGRIESVQISGLMAEVRVSIGGQQITSIITTRSAREMQLKRGQTGYPRGAVPHKGYRRNDLAGLTHEEPTLSTRPHRSAAGAALAQCHHQQINDPLPALLV